MIHSAGWIPATVHGGGTSPTVQWCHLGELRFTDPFFEQTIWRAMKHPFNLLFSHHTPLNELEEQGRELRLAGLIFHMSHCGSTLVSRMLAALDRNVVLSEPAPLDRILKLPARLRDVSDEQLVRWMRGVVAAHDHRFGDVPERHAFLGILGEAVFVGFAETIHTMRAAMARGRLKGLPP